MRDAHFDLKIPPEVFDEVDAERGRSLDHFNLPDREKGEVLAAFGGWKEEVTAGSQEGLSIGVVGVELPLRRRNDWISSSRRDVMTSAAGQMRDERRAAQPA